jgi:signal transduction histidine kinase
MKPSLVRRLTVGYVLAHAIAVLLLFTALFPLMIANERHGGSQLLLHHLTRDLKLEQGRLMLRDDAGVLELARQSPGLWFTAHHGGSSLSFGEVPDRIRRSNLLLSQFVETAQLRNIGTSGNGGEASITEVEPYFGDVRVAAGGIEADKIGIGTWFDYLLKGEFLWAPVFTALFTLAGAIVAVPIILRSIGPAARALSRIDGRNLKERIPEENVVKELLPFVQSVNGALDQAAEAYEKRRRFIADVAHELRTPLASLAIRADNLPDGQGKFDMQRVVYRFSDMVAQMLDAERLALADRRHEPVDLVDATREIVTEVAPLAIAGGYEIAFDPPVGPVIVSADRHAILRAISNLLGNAIAHGGNTGLIQLRVGLDRVVEVSDEGPGVSAAARQRIFEPFSREHPDRDGCGLGLYLVQTIMEAHGGRVSLKNSARGASFLLNFPKPADEHI